MSGESAFTINNLNIPLQVGGLRRSYKRWGSKKSAVTGRPVKAHRGRVTAMAGTTTYQSRCEAATLQLLVHGLWDRWGLEGDFIGSDGGVVPELPKADHEINPSAAPDGSNSITITTSLGGADTITYDARFTADFTISYEVSVSGEFVPVVWWSDGRALFGGSSLEGLAAPPLMSVLGTRFALISPNEYANIKIFYDHISPQLARTLQQSSGSWVGWPYLTVQGGCCQTPTVVVGVSARADNYQSANRGSGWDCGLRKVSFDLESVCLGNSKGLGPSTGADVWLIPDSEHHENFEVLEGWPA